MDTAIYEQRFWELVKITDGCWEWQAYRMPFGYGLIGSKRFGSRLAHRFSWLLHNGDIPNGLLVLHKCDNPPCVRPDHLFLGTDADNMNDMASKGRQVRVGRKLNMDQVRDIRSRVASGASQRSLASEFGLTNNAIWQIVHGLTYPEAMDAA